MSKRLPFIILSMIISSVFNSWAVDFSKLDTSKDIYYVKKGGTGDGSSWDKALGNTEFNYVLAKARNGATFHIAAGKYVPTLNSALEETTSLDARYTINNSVTLIGGYPENPSAGDVSDPSKNETLFSTDVLGDNIPNEYKTNRDDDLTSCLVINCKQKDNGDYEKVTLNGISFEGIKDQYPGFNTVCNVFDCNFVVDKCTFKGCYNGLKLEKCNATITDCTFEENYSAFTWTIGNINVYKSTFYKNDDVRFNPSSYYAFGAPDDYVHRTINVDNCTFFENKFFVIGGKIDSDCNFKNNTISMSDTTFIITSDGAVSLIGNIIYAKKINKKNGGSVSSKYNYYASVNIDATLPSNTDKTGENCPFIATKLSKNGGYTQTLALNYDTDADGNTLRFPRSECGLVNDQRQMVRAEETCVGAFEKGATEYAALIIDMPYDTIFANQTYKIDGKYYPIGKHLITEKIKNKSGQDSIIYNHTLWVFPDPTITKYYVTKNGTGDKSGKSWENSMCDSSFAYSTSKVPNGTTFHIAEGIYHPIYTETGKETTNNNKRTFFTNSLINIIGGYSEKEPTSPRDPSKYKTILSGDIDENDDDSQYSDDDAYNVLLYRPSIFGEIKISGVSFEHTTANRGATDALLAVEDKLLDKNAYGFIKLNVDSCEFTKADKAIITYHTVFHFNNCIFVRNGTPAYIYLYQNKAYDEKNISIIENSSFNNTYLYLYSVSCILRNNVIDKLYTDKLWEEEINATIYNNTILDDARLEDCNCKLTGNIFTKDVELSSIESFESAYNIYNINSKVNIEEFVGSSDKFIEPDDFLSILKNENGEFISENNGGYTPSVAVISDELPDGSSIRFPLDKKLCQTDQRGISRFAYTTPGSFEGDCITKETHLETIEYVEIGSRYYNNTLTTAGLQTVIAEKKTLCGADSLIYHKVMVTPSVKKDVYYVKTKKSGKGDGSSWENAMNDTMFSYVLANLETKAIFHIAEGTYVPFYSIDETSQKRHFYTQMPITIIGGYPNNNTDKNVGPDPVKYVTTFTNDTEKSTEIGFDYSLLKIDALEEDSIIISGITFTLNSSANTRELLLGYSSKESSGCIVIDHCTFKNAPYGLWASGSVLVKNSRFTTGHVFHLLANPSIVDISGCEFNNNTSLSSIVNTGFTMSNSTFVGEYLNINAPVVDLYNNTLLAESFNVSNSNETNIIGNIISNIDYETSTINSCDYNLSQQNLGESNIYVKDFYDILDYDKGEKKFVFTNNNTYTNAVRIINNTLTGGRIIQMPLDKTKVTDDQWGRKRHENTSIGALEVNSDNEEQNPGGNEEQNPGNNNELSGPFVSIDVDYNGTPNKYWIVCESSPEFNVDTTEINSIEEIGVYVPETVNPGIYNITVGIISGTEETTLDTIIKINYPSSYIHIIWNDVLGVDNSNHLFNTYQWYKNGVLIPGATKQYFQDKDGLEGNYMVLVNNELFIEPAYINIDEFLWMNVQTDKNIINVKTTGSIPQGSKIEIYNALGLCVKSKNAESVLQFNVSPGIYIVKFSIPRNSINVSIPAVKVQVK